MPAFPKALLFLLLLCSVCLNINAAAVAPPARQDPPAERMIFSIAAMEKLAGRKLTLREKIAVKIARHHYMHRERGDEPTDQQVRQGKLAMVFGIIAFPLVLIPAGILLAVPFAIVAVVLGAKSIRGNTNFPGLLGFILGLSFLTLIVLGLIIFALFFRFK